MVKIARVGVIGAAYAGRTIDDLFAKAAEKSEAPFFLVLIQ